MCIFLYISLLKKLFMTPYRDAGTGKYVSKEYAEKNPKTTVKETDKSKPKPSKTKKKK